MRDIQYRLNMGLLRRGVAHLKVTTILSKANMTTLHVNGSIELNGTKSVLVKIPDIKSSSPVNLIGFSKEMSGKAHLGQTIPGVGFELKSSSDLDKGVVAYFIVRQPYPVRHKA